MNRPKATGESGLSPETREELNEWVRSQLRLSAHEEEALANAIDRVFQQYEQRWQQAVDDAVSAASVGFAERLDHMRGELSARDATIQSIAKKFEALML